MTPRKRLGRPRKAVDDFLRASVRVGTIDLERTKWLLGFHQRIWPSRADLNLRWEALAFAMAAASDKTIVTDTRGQMTQPPAWSEVVQASAALEEWFHNLRAGRVTRVTVGKWSASLWMRKGVIKGAPATDGLSFRDAFVHRAYNALTELAATHRRILFCSECRRPFIAKRNDSTKCSPSCRTKAWRREHRKEFKEYRKKYYRNKKAKELSVPPEKVRMHEKKAAS